MMMQEYYTTRGSVLVNALATCTYGRIVGVNETKANLLYQEEAATPRSTAFLAY
jgi:hypothetical protein